MLQLPTIKPIKRAISRRPRASIDTNDWVWPLPSLEDLQPQIVGHANDDRMAVYIGYQDAGAASQLVPVYAANAGAIQLARETVSGFAMVIDHHGEWSSYYARLHQMVCSPTWDDSRRKVRVSAGQLIGYAMMETPIRFELWRWTNDAGFVPTAPEPQMIDWRVLRERDRRLSCAPHVTTEITKSAA